MNKRWIPILLLFLVGPVFGQEPVLPSLIETEANLAGDFSKLYALPDSPERDSLNESIIHRFRYTLHTWDSFFYSWSRLKNIGIFRSRDNRVRVYTWYLENDRGGYTYYGFIQHLTGKKKKKQHVEVFGLHDRHASFKNPEMATETDTSRWYGCLYYGIRAFKKRRNNYYVLFGYQFNNQFSHKKLLEVLTFDRKDQPVFGGDFVLEKKTVRRFILEYSSEVVVSMRYNQHLAMIVFDHIEPFQPIFKGSYRFYGPDGSFDGFLFDDGKFLLKKDVDARNY